MKVETSTIYIFIFIILAIALPILAFTLSRFLRPHKSSHSKGTTYESGATPVGGSWVQFNVQYYLYALLFVIFDVEVVLLYPVAASYDLLRSQLGVIVLIEFLAFILFLALGLVYAWRKKVLDWK